MSLRRSLKLPITLGVVMMILLVVLIVGWVVLAVLGALSDAPSAGLFWTLLPIGTTFILLLLVGVIIYLILSVKAINLNRRQSNFIDSVTHELKSPIASMKLCLQTLNRREVTPQQQTNFHRFMLEDLERLDHLINQMLDAGRLDSTTVHGEHEDVDLPALLAQCAEAVCLRYRVAPETVRIDSEPCVVWALRGDLDMVFRNLLDNAVKYAGTPPSVQVTVRPEPNGSTVTRIADNGRGIPHKFRRKVFGRFVRLGLELQRDKPGTGLGLYIVHTIVRRLRGWVRIRDREEGSGTVLEVRLPGGEPATRSNGA